MTRAGRLLLFALAGAGVLAGCERARDAERSPTNGGQAKQAVSTAPIKTTSSATSRNSAIDGLQFRDWTVDPNVVPEEVHTPCPRLLSAAPNVTEMCAALGLIECLVGRTRYCTWPPSVEQAPSIGALNDLNPEVLLDLHPDLTLVSGTSRAITDRLTRLGLKYVSLPDDSLADLFTSLGKLGETTGRARTAGALADEIRGQMEQVRVAFRGTPPARVLITLGPMSDPPGQIHAAGPGLFYGDLLALAGHSNAAASSPSPIAPVSLEFILAADPDVIIELAADMGPRATDTAALAAWARVGPLKAVQTGRVHVLPGAQHFLLGPRIAETFAGLCECIARGAK